MSPLHKVSYNLYAKENLKKHLLDKLPTITGTNYLERKPTSCPNFGEKQ